MDFATLFSTFGLLFVAELGDKTQLAVITQTCKFRRPWPVFLGGALALAAVTGLGVAFGRLLSALVPAIWMQRIAGAAFVVMGLIILVGALRQMRQTQAVVCEDVECAPERARRLNWQAFSSTFGLLFIAELGDKTQLAALSMASESSSPWPVFIGGSLALVAVTGLGVAFGQGLTRLIPERVLKLVSAAAFIVIGILMGIGVF